MVNFNIESINIPEEEMNKVQEVFSKTLEAKELSKVEVGGAFTTIKSFEVLNNAASNQSDGSVGSMLGAGIGLGAGLPIGGQLGQHLDVSGNKQTEDSTEKLRKLKAMLDEGLITQDQFETKRDQILESI